MFDPIRRSTVPSIALVVLLVAACGSPTPAASPGQSAAPSPSNTPTPGSSASPSGAAVDLEDVAAEITAQVEAIRGLKATAPIDVTILDEAELIEHIKTSFAEDTPPELIEGTDGLYKRMGLIAADEDVGELYIELLGSQTLGLYDEDAKQLFIVDRRESGTIGPLERFALSHELTHALGDQAFGLSTVVPDVTDQGDRLLASLSLVEGDASVLMVQWATRHLTQADLVTLLAQIQETGEQEVLERMPRILKDTLQFPYVQGVSFVSRYDWEGVDAMYAKPPMSTEQIMHPEKYEAGEQPLAVEIPDDLAERIGSGWSVGLEDTLGEFQTQIWLADAGKVLPVPAVESSQGWGGDRVAYLTGPDSSDAVVWRTSWDSPADAEEFDEAATTAQGAITSPMIVAHEPGSTEVTIIFADDQESLVQVDSVAGLTGV